MEAPETLQKAIALFSDPQKAFEAAVEFRWPGGNVTCPRCNGAKHSFIKTRRLWFCYDCKKQFTVKVGTVMEDSPIGLDKWMIAIWMLANCKNGISSYELAKVLGVRQNSAWFMLHRIRKAMQDDPAIKLGGPEGGPVEVDEAYIGGEAKNKYGYGKTKRSKFIKDAATGDTSQIQTGLRIVDAEPKKFRFSECWPGSAQDARSVCTERQAEALMDAILGNVQKGGTIYSDSYGVYNSLKENEFVHDAVNHLKEYVRGQVHTNGIENFWSLRKRSLKRTYVSVEPFHLGKYLDEQVFRYDNRATKDNKLTDSDRFAYLMTQVAGKRLTYEELTGKGTDSLHSPEAGTGQKEPF